MSDELIERLRKQRPSGECVTVARLMDDAANEIERLTAEVRRPDYSTIHTCHAECPRLACAQRREIEALTAQLARARQEGWNAAIEAAAGEADHLGGERVERNPDGSLCTYDMASKHGQGSATLNAMRVRAQTIATAIRALASNAPANPSDGGGEG